MPRQRAAMANVPIIIMFFGFCFLYFFVFTVFSLAASVVILLRLGLLIIYFFSVVLFIKSICSYSFKSLYVSLHLCSS